jgi:glycosyltransferase involved in cell wall biosynthesis
LSDDSERPLRVLHVLGRLGPAHGGPIVVALNLAAARGAAGLPTTIVAGTDAPEGGPERELIRSLPGLEDVPIHTSNPVRRLASLARDADIVHVHGAWGIMQVTAGRAARRLGVPYLFSPAGMLDQWCLSYKPLRKKLALLLGMHGVFKNAGVLHASAPAEVEGFRRLRLPTPAAVIGSGVDASLAEASTSETWNHLPGPRRLLYLSRLHPVKGLPNLLHAFAAVAAAHPDWHLVIAGPSEAGERARAETLSRELQLDDRTSFLGPVHGKAKADLYAAAELFVLPSLSENFGLVVPEALAAGLPVVTTQATPWEQLETVDCGRWIPVGAEPLARTLDELLACSREELRESGRRGRALAVKEYSWQSVGEQMESLYRWLRGGTEPPFIVRPG